MDQEERSPAGRDPAPLDPPHDPDDLLRRDRLVRPSVRVPTGPVPPAGVDGFGADEAVAPKPPCLLDEKNFTH
jgi:hypothetical protein